jgi:hydrogenase expression/formation protein HypE
MKPGKFTASELESIVFPLRGQRRADVLVRSGVGLDCAVLDLDGDAVVLSSDPITGARENAGWLAIHMGCNDVATTGARPVGVLLTLLLAPSRPLEDARTIMADAERAAESVGVEIVGGHTEIAPGIPSSIVVVTAVGRVARNCYLTSGGARPGDSLLLSKTAGLEGTAILAADRASYLGGRVPDDVVERARRFGEEISVVPEALAASGAGASALHDATEGGILGALAELGTAAGYGVEVDAELIPVRPETRAICRAFDIDPLALVSSGSLLIATPHPDAVAAAIRAGGGQVTGIGRIVDGPSRIKRQGASQPLVAPERDALWDALAHP